MDQTLSHSLFARAQTLIPGGVNSPVRAFRGVGGEPFFIERAQGAHIWDVDGNVYIDYVGTWGPAILGHAPAVVIEAIRDAAPRGVSFGIPNPLEVEMAAHIRECVPSIEKVRMVNSGTEATMSCIRLARGFTGRDKIVKFDGCYHGHADCLLVKAGSGALTHGEPDSAGVPAAFANLTITLPFNDVTAILSLFMAEGSKIAAVILEPIPANAGLYFPQPGFLEFLRQQCSEYGIVLIFDEVMTGFRVARGGAQELYSVSPDLTALGKVIGGGLPVGAVGGRADIMTALFDPRPGRPRLAHGGTFNANPMTMAAGRAAMRLFDLAAFERLSALGDRLRKGLHEAVKISGAAATVKGAASLTSLFHVDAPARTYRDLQAAMAEDPGARGRTERFFRHMLAGGVIIGAPGLFVLSTALTEADIDRICDVALQGLRALEQVAA